MRSIDKFIVLPKGGKRYDNTRSIGGLDFVVSISNEDAEFATREAIVVETPLNYQGEIERGDVLLVHHNIFKFYYDMQGNLKSSTAHIEGQTFMIEPDNYFAYKKNGEWKARDRFCFVRPILNTNRTRFNTLKYEPLLGEVVYPNDFLLSCGVCVGDKIVFTPDSEYIFHLDGEILYRVYDHQITIQLN